MTDSVFTRKAKIACPSGCGGTVTWVPVLDADHNHDGGQLEHNEPICDAFEEGDVIPTLLEALRDGKFEPEKSQ